MVAMMNSIRFFRLGRLEPRGWIQSSLTFVFTLLVPALTFAAPLVLGPMQVDDNGSVSFLFTEVMADPIDVAWSGNGIDSAQITCS